MASSWLPWPTSSEAVKNWEIVMVRPRAEDRGPGDFQVPKARAEGLSQPGPRAPQCSTWLPGHLQQVEHKNLVTAAWAGHRHTCGRLEVLAAALGSGKWAVIAQPAECDLIVGTLLTVCDHYALLGSLCRLPAYSILE